MSTPRRIPSDALPPTRAPLAVVGLGCLFPGASDVCATWAMLRDGNDQITELPPTHWRPEDHFDEDVASPDRTYGRRGGFLDPVDFRPIEFGIAPRDLEATDTAQLLGLYAAREALRDAGILDRDQQAKRRVSVLLGVTGALELVIPLGARLGHPMWWRALAAAGVDRDTAAEVVRQISDSTVRWQENSFPGLLGNVVAGRIANRLDLGGTNCVVDAACASSLGAVHLASMELESGRADAVVTGGVDTFNDIFMYTCFSKTPALSPSGHARPFDRDGDGTTLGEGIGIVVLKRLADAERDGDKIYAKLLGIGSSSDGKGTAIYAPSSEGQTRCLEAAYRDAEVTPDTIELIEAHGTGTAVGDAAEVRGLTTVFRKHRAEGTWCQLGSVKSQIGHTKSAAGAAGLVKAVLALHHKVLPPTIKVEHPLDELAPGASPFELSHLPRPWIRRGETPRRAGVSAFGFGGSNFHAVLEEAERKRTSIDFAGAPLLLAFSGSDPSSIVSALETKIRELADADRATSRAIAAKNRSGFDVHARYRLLLTAPPGEISERLDRAHRELATNSSHPWTLPDGIVYGVGAPQGSLAFLFPGQGSQRIGMLRDLACRTPELLAALEEAEESYWIDEADPIPLSTRIYPADPFDEGRERRLDEALRETRTAQPAIGAVSLGAARLLARFGVRPAAVAGHSYGELTALQVAGRLREEDFHQLSNFRGRLMAEAGGEAAGAMAAVDLPLADLDRLVVEERLDLVVANRNAPRQGVISGRTDEIARALAACERRGIRATRLPVAAAFHSPLIAGARGPFREVLRKVKLSPGTIPVYANTTAGRYSGDEEAAKELLAGQLAQPVRFLDEIETMVGDGVRTFLEVGPGGTLTSLVRSTLGDRAVAVSIEASNGRRDGMLDLALALMTIAGRGHDLDLTVWDGGEVAHPMPAPRKGPSIPVCGANLRPGTAAPLAPLPVVAPPTDLTWPPPKPAREEAPPPLPTVTPDPIESPPTVASAPEPGFTLPPRTPGIDDATWSALRTLETESRQMQETVLESQRELARTVEQLIAETRAAAPPTVEGGARVASTATPARLPTAVPVAPAPPPPSDATLVPALVAIVAERTGYPAEAIDPAMDLEADLGIDSIKRVEILSALRTEQPQLPSPPPELLGTLRTLEEIAGWFAAQEGESAEPVLAAPEPKTVAASAPAVVAPRHDATLIPALIAIVADRTGYPAEAIDPAMDLEADLGIDSIKRVEILSALRTEQPQLPSPPPELLGTLRTLDEIAGWFEGETKATPAPVAPSVPLTSSTPRPSPPSPPSPPAAEAPAPDTNLIPALIAIVADRTGYPADAIDPAMDLEADLGIDSIKRVEILSALRTEQPHLPSPPPERLGTLRTLDEIAGWFEGETKGTPAPAAPSAGPKPSTPSTATAAVPAPNGNLIPALIAIVADRTGYPADAIDPAMDLEADLGIDSIKRVEILSALRTEQPHLPSPPPELLGTLRTLDEIAGWFEGETTATPAPAAPPTPAVPSAAPTPSASRAAAPTTGADLVPSLIAIVADRTGYPADAIDPAMDLEADLGIDSIKRVEILSALRNEEPHLPSPPPELLGTLRTLDEIAAWFSNASGPAAAADSPARLASEPALQDPPPSTPPPSTVPASTVTVTKDLDRPENELSRRVVDAILAPRLIEGGLPIPARGDVWVAGDPRDRLVSALAEQLRALGVPARAVPIGEPLQLEGSARLLVLVPPPNAGTEGILTAFERVQEIADSLQSAGVSGGARVVTVSRLDGAFGLRDFPVDADLLPSALTGLVKTIPHEWPGVEGRAVDIDPTIEDSPATIAQVAAAVLADGPAEIGIRAEGSIILEERDAPYRELAVDPLPIGRGDLVVVTGGGRGVTAECAIAIAKDSRATLLILGRSPLPPVEPEWQAACHDEVTLKRALFRQSVGLPPREIGARAHRILAGRELRKTLDRIEEVGGRAIYTAVDVRDSVAVEAALADARRHAGPIRGWIHGAGVIEDRTIEEKTRASFERVVRTKVDGAETIAAAIEPDEARAIIFFSSSTARYGRRGQVDYAVANEALNRLARREALRRPNCRVAALGWGPWNGGMVTPGLAHLFAKEGVGLIELDAGSAACIREMACPAGSPAWVTLIGPSPDGTPLPRMRTEASSFRAAFESPTREAEPLPIPSAPDPRPTQTAPEPIDAPPAPRTIVAASEPGPPRLHAPQPSDFETSLSFELDPASMPVLADHVIDGRAVLPFALMLEWGAEAALHRHPGLQLEALEKWRVLKGVVVPPGGTVTIEARVAPAETEGDRLHVKVELVGIHADHEVLHVRGTAILTPSTMPTPAAAEPPPLDPDPRTVVEAYDEHLFHGPTLRGIDRLIGCSETGIAALCHPAPDPRAWLAQPRRSRWVLDPLLIDAAFQLQILWSTRTTGSPCLPCYVERLERFAGAPLADPTLVRVTFTDRGEHGARSEIEILDADGEPRLRLRGAECVIDPSLARAFRSRRLGSAP